MKKLLLLVFITSFTTYAQIPANYYDTATGTGYTLKTQLRNIIANGHTSQGYDNLYNGYVDAFSDNDYEGDGSVLDFYSENPNGTDSYYYTHGNRKCGNYSSENDCYNREHLMPQSVFGSASPMQSDIFTVVPSDGYVNGKRSSHAFGEVGSASWTSDNGSKVGSNTYGSYNGTVFEPIDEFKGDIARAMLYFAVRYENQVASWSHAMLNGTSDQVYADWFIDMLLEWHANDPVHTSETVRNVASYDYQGNANPFIDHPEFVQMIWNPTPDNQDPTVPTNLVTSNPTGSSIDLDWTASTDNIAVSSYDIYVDGTYYTSATTNSKTVTGLASETTFIFTVLAKDAANNTSAQSTSANGTTLEASAGGSECVAETFENIPANSSSYSDQNWTGDNGLTWSATSARTDQTLNNRGLVLDGRGSTNGTLTSTSITGGIGEITLSTQRVYNGGSGDLSVFVNGDLKGTIPYDGSVQTTTISNINVSGNVIVTIKEDTTGGDRVVIDDLTWTCFSALSVNDYSLENSSIYPNPTSGNTLTIAIFEDVNITVFDILGKKVLKDEISIDDNQVDISNLNSGIYMIHLQAKNGSVTKKFIKK